MEVVYNGVAVPTASVEALPAVVTPPVRLLLVGRISPRKGTDVAVEALGLLRDKGVDATLTLVGSTYAGYEWYERSVRRRVTELGLADKVTFASFVHDVWSAHSRSDIALMPSRVEPFGNAAVEAMLAGRPVIASDIQGLREIITSSDTGLLVPPDDPAALAGAVHTLLDDWASTCQLAKRGQGAVALRFSPQMYATMLESAVERTVAR
jgi:glycosyltransferase involved in cell wall biosynthesis